MNDGLSKSQIFSLALYLVFLIASVWATGQSIARSTYLPMPICYTIGLAALLGASFCLNLVKKSLSSGSYVSNRTITFIVGISGFLFLWLVSLTSNTHNFYYVMTIDDLQQKELRVVKNGLEDINKNSIASFELAREKFSSEIDDHIKEMMFEIQNIGDPGHGIKTDSIITTIEKLLGGKSINRLDPPGNDRISLRNHAIQMSKMIRELKNTKLNEIDSRINKLEEYIDGDDYNRIMKELPKTINDYFTIDERKLNSVLRDSYSLYDKCSGYVRKLFKTPFLEKYTKLKLDELPSVPESIELKNIARSWRNFLGGIFDPYHFRLALIWALTIDVACFILFYFGVLPSEND